MRTILAACTVAISILLAPQQAAAIEVKPAQPAAAAEHAHTLTITANRQSHDIAIADIEALPRFAVDMKGPWGMDGTFSGVRMVDLLELAGVADATRLHLRAADDYKITLEPGKEEGFDQLLFITRFNGKTMAIANKGPFRLIWPHNADIATAGDASTVKWIWSIVEIRKVR